MRARDIASYFLHHEPDLFTDDLIELNGKIMREGNFRINKYLHIAQNVYIAKEGKLLFDDPIYAYLNGGVVKDVQTNFAPIKSNAETPPVIDEGTQSFLNAIAKTLRYATAKDLMEISHQDQEWIEKNNTEDQKMNSLSRADEYKEKYKDILSIMESDLC